MKYLLFVLLVVGFYLVYAPLWVVWHFKPYPVNWLYCQASRLGEHLKVKGCKWYEWDYFEGAYYDYSGPASKRVYPFTNKS
jgi:hypothetical protein